MLGTIRSVLQKKEMILL